MSRKTQIATQVIAALGGTSATARAVGAPATTVSAWKKIGIPRWWRQALIEAAKGLNVTLPERFTCETQKVKA